MKDAASTSDIEADATAWRSALRWALVALVLSRLVVWGAGLAALAIWGVHEPHATGFDPGGLTRPFGQIGNDLVGPGARWDSVWILQIGSGGYEPDPNRAAFFPLYPGLVALFGGGVVAGLLVSWACFLGALTLFHRLAVREVGAAAAPWATMALALFPGAHWFSAVYTESLFLLLSVGAVLAAREDRWLLAGACAALGAATRSAGVLLVVPLALLWWDAYRAGLRPPLHGAVAAGAGPLLGLAGVCLTFALIGPGWSAPFEAQETWNRTFRGPAAGLWDGTAAAWDGVRQLIHGRPPPLYFTEAAGDPLAIARHNVLLWLTLALAVALLIGVWRRLSAAHAAYATAALLLPLSYPVAPQPLMSMPRFAAVLYPLFLVAGLGLARMPRAAAVSVLAASAGGLAAVSAIFTCWRWVA
ncbi:MAG: mannosyltransferase family protein [Baekduia sp.]